MNLIEIGDALIAQPLCWRDIPVDYRAVVQAELLPTAQGFAEGQRGWFAKWWLACTQEDVAAINAVLPAGTRVAAIEVEGSLYLGSDLLTDSLHEGQLYYPAQTVIQGLICTYFAELPAAPVGQP